ncbi:MAG: polysaccharide deacetylase family protein [Clostridiaceae bacterium]|nr:polysaccharide deacetylase family protein [Clostridiaceae bacterium]
MESIDNDGNDSIDGNAGIGGNDDESYANREQGGNENQGETGTNSNIAANGEVTHPGLQPGLEEVKPNEAGKVMIVMFHNFVETFTETKYDKGEYTMTFDSFRELLHNLYERGYRPVSLKDYLENNIPVPAGCVPIVFTFDDGTPGQFNLVEENGTLKANRKSAVGIMEEFSEMHPDFELRGTFFVNLGTSAFSGKGTLAERLEYLIEKGFEIGNHTLNHANLTTVKSVEKMLQEVGGNQKKMYELVPGYKMFAFSLPYGNPSKGLFEYVISGEYEGIRYENLAILEVGAHPALASIHKNFNPYSVPRVRSPGINPEKFDLYWWLENISRDDEYISDGNPDTITVPRGSEENITMDRSNGRELVVYEK